ncbi:hypothetical protein GCM10010172_30950 [Paractinoplanes ferrugineus]|jgi:hypothetical protein|uniref:DUF397 domain-containing protein n=1 Tax=Paractinoplanes ferrugineus TaxID=113564 RepID=A0A919J577_9ACTN|nr:DUF397 domain-containing protein [Actinoplanes ferrugineus]GIE14213.1 hypothetical protein Afe05nite_60530 [Actinoplanes ferrugineus]
MKDALQPAFQNANNETADSGQRRQPGQWFKSGRSGGGSDCVEVCYLEGGGVKVRNSKRPDAGTLQFTDSEFDAWVGGAKDGDFDR